MQRALARPPGEAITTTYSIDELAAMGTSSRRCDCTGGFARTVLVRRQMGVAGGPRLVARGVTCSAAAPRGCGDRESCTRCLRPAVSASFCDRARHRAIVLQALRMAAGSLVVAAVLCMSFGDPRLAPVVVIGITARSDWRGRCGRCHLVRTGSHQRGEAHRAPYAGESKPDSDGR